MAYYISTTLNHPFEESIKTVTEALHEEGFGVLTDIDVKATMKKKLGVDFRQYRILGACNPPYAHRVLEAEDKIGTQYCHATWSFRSVRRVSWKSPRLTRRAPWRLSRMACSTPSPPRVASASNGSSLHCNDGYSAHHV